MSEEQGELNYLRMVRVKLVEDLPLLSTEPIRSPQSALETALEMIIKEVGSFDREVLFVLNLNTQNQPLNASMISMGTLTQSSAHPREILKASILSNAARMILFHNHPSGDTYPSPADIEVTTRMQIAGNLIGIDVLDHLIVNQEGEFTSLRSEGLLLENIPTHVDLENVTTSKQEIQEVKEETFIKENTTPDNLEKFQILSRRKDYLKQEKLNLELEAISYVDTSKVDAEIKKVDEVINNFLSKEQKEHIIEFLKTQGEGEYVQSEESNSYWKDIYYGGVPLTVKMVESDYYMNLYKAWGNFLIEEFKNGNISWDSLINAGYEPNKEIEFYKKHEKNIDNQPTYRKVIAVEEKTSASLVFEVRKYELPKLYLIDLQGEIITTFEDGNDRLLDYGNYFFGKDVANNNDYESIVEETKKLNPEYTFNVDQELILTRNLSLENRVSIPSLENHYTIEEPKVSYSIKTPEEKKAELEELSRQIQTKVNEFSANPETIKDFLLFKRQFPTYSMNNTFLIFNQNPSALGVGAFGFWKKQGYSVKRGETGISIYAPIVSEMIIDREGKFVTTTKNATPEDLHLVQLGQYTKRTTVAGFQKKTVFDITQTTAPLEKYPKIVRDMYELNHLEQYRVQNMAINRFLEKNGIQLIDYDKAGVGRSALGYFIPSEKEIYLQEDLTPIARFKTAVHETAHGILHPQGSTLSKAEREYQAQFTMLVVADTLGIPMKEEDYGYIKSYQESLSDEKRRELLEGVLKTAEMVLETYEETLTQVQSQTLTPEEAKEAQRLQLNIPSLSVTDIQEIIHYPATDKQKYLLVSKLVENNFGEMSQEEKYQLVEDQANFIKTKVKDGHRYYQLGILNEAELSRTGDNQLELHIVSMTGAETTQVFEDEEQVAELLLKKEAIPVPDSAVVYAKNVVQRQQERERQLEQTNRQEREQQL